MTSRTHLFISLGIIIAGTAAIFTLLKKESFSSDRERSLHPSAAAEEKQWYDLVRG